MALVFLKNFVYLKRSSARFQAVSRVKGLFSYDSQSVSLPHGNSAWCRIFALCPSRATPVAAKYRTTLPTVWQFCSGQKNYETASVLFLNNNHEFSRYKDIKLNSLGPEPAPSNRDSHSRVLWPGTVAAGNLSQMFPVLGSQSKSLTWARYSEAGPNMLYFN